MSLHLIVNHLALSVIFWHALFMMVMRRKEGGVRRLMMARADSLWLADRLRLDCAPDDGVQASEPQLACRVPLGQYGSTLRSFHILHVCLQLPYVPCFGVLNVLM